jgi:AcrR family transcriptional regulator
VPRSQVVEIQRSRLLAAAVGSIEEVGYTRTTVGSITDRARVSRRTFYEMFANRDECLAAMLEDVLAAIGGELAATGLAGLGWRERVRMGLWAILSFFDREPVLARVCVVEVSRGGPEVLRRREDLEKVFAENPANCPKASQVGQVKVSTPVLPGGLTGTAYFVSHGGAKYPELIMVLTGQNGVTVQVHGETFISKQGITSATFSTVPDVPFSDFELTLPQREYPALTANGNLCQAQAAGKLLMPTEMVGQNGLVINQNTKIAVTGCPKHKKAAKRVKRNNKRKTHNKKR